MSASGSGGFTKAEATTLRVLSHLLITAAVLGIGYSAYRNDIISLILFLIIIIAAILIKYIYWLRLCRTCSITSCPFNPKRRFLSNVNLCLGVIGTHYEHYRVIFKCYTSI